MNKLYWQVNNELECYELREKDAIADDGELEDAIVAQVYDMEEFIRFCANPDFPTPPKPEGKPNE